MAERDPAANKAVPYSTAIAAVSGTRGSSWQLQGCSPARVQSRTPFLRGLFSRGAASCSGVTARPALFSQALHRTKQIRKPTTLQQLRARQPASGLALHLAEPSSVGCQPKRNAAAACHSSDTSLLKTQAWHSTTTKMARWGQDRRQTAGVKAWVSCSSCQPSHSTHLVSACSQGPAATAGWGVPS